MEHCPTCRARLKAASVCPRCGTEISLLLEIITQAEISQKQAVISLFQGDLAAAQSAISYAVTLKQEPLTLILQSFILHCRETMRKDQYRQAQEALQILSRFIDSTL